VLADLIKKDKLEQTLKLNEKETENLTTIDETGKLRIFQTPEEIVTYFVDIRLAYYDKRKEYLKAKLERDLLILTNRSRFIKSIIENKLKVNKVPRAEIEQQLDKLKFDKIDGSYSYLLSMAIYNLTLEKYNELLKEVADKEKELEALLATKTIDMYLEDLNELKKAIKNEY
jgi:DNA topoisomerase-2